MKSGRYVLGIDLGTTNTLCAVWHDGELAPCIAPINQPTTDESTFGAESPLPSAVLLRPDKVLVGDYPKYLSRFGIDKVITSVKREMGTPWVESDGRRSWSPEEVSACILRAVRHGIGLPKEGPPPARVVITVPAGFGMEQRRATLRAASLAGFDLNHVDLFDEPTAALLHQTRHTHVKDAWPVKKRMMVLDIGGGTLDVSCIDIQSVNGALTADVLGRSRFNELAGDDFDLNLAGLLLARFQNDKGLMLENIDEELRRQLCAGLLSSAEEAKKDLCERARGKSDEEQEKLFKRIEVMLDTTLAWRGRLTMADMGHALRPFFIRSSDATARLTRFSFFTAIQECFDSMTAANVEDGDRLPDYVFLAGGSANLPFIKRVVSNFFAEEAAKRDKAWNVEPEIVDKPMDAIALGAAWYAGARAGLCDSGGVVLEQRMHEGIYLITGSGLPLELVKPSEKLPVRELLVPHELEAGTSDRLELELVTGVGREDVNMRPLLRGDLRLSGVVPKGTPIRLYVAVDENIVASLRCEATVNNEIIIGNLEEGSKSPGAEESSLVPVNIEPKKETP